MQRSRSVRDLSNLPRSAALSHLYRSAEAVSPPNLPRASLFSPAAAMEFIRHYLAYVLRPKHFFPPHTASPNEAIYELVGAERDGLIRISIAGDWGTGTEEAQAVATQIEKFEPHFTIHLGDVYYVGDPPEVNENCLGIRDPRNNFDPVTWPIGRNGSFALNGNHEMYANGVGYFDMLLPRLGLRKDPCDMSGQQTSFFCLQNRWWRIIAVDTGYNSTGVPVLAGIPLINRIPLIGGDCKLRSELTDWLTQIVCPEKDERGLIVMSHHQYYSGFDQQYPKPARQLWNAGVRRPVLWFWGHEHRLAGYDLGGPDHLKAHGRCVGHGGMPVERGGPKERKPMTPIFYDNRLAKNGFGFNGHVNLTFSGPNLVVDYVDLNGQHILHEEWKVGGGGAVQLVCRTKVIEDPDFIA